MAATEPLSIGHTVLLWAGSLADRTLHVLIFNVDSSRNVSELPEVCRPGSADCYSCDGPLPPYLWSTRKPKNRIRNYEFDLAILDKKLTGELTHKSVVTIIVPDRINKKGRSLSESLVCASVDDGDVAELALQVNIATSGGQQVNLAK